MAKIIVVTAAAAPGIVTALDAQARAAPLRATRVRQSARATSPASWNGVGAVPAGWALPYGVLPELGGARVAIVATDEFALGNGQFLSATEALPADWKVEDGTIGATAGVSGSDDGSVRGGRAI